MMGPSALGFPHFSNAAVMLSVLDFFILIYKTKRFAVFRNLQVISMRFSYVILCGVYMNFCAIFRYSYPPYSLLHMHARMFSF